MDEHYINILKNTKTNDLCLDEFEDNYDIDDNKNIDQIKKIKISEKLKFLNDNSKLILDNFNIMLKKIMYFTYKDPKFKLLQNELMYEPINLLPYTKISNIELLSSNGSYGINRICWFFINKYGDFVNSIRIELAINRDYQIDIDSFEIKNIFNSIKIVVGNLLVDIKMYKNI
jgi:hypothetical protein